MVASVRPDDWNLPLFLHLIGAMVLVGALVTAAYFLFTARRDGTIEALRAGHRTLLLGALPAYIVMRVGAQWIASKEGLEDSEDAWIGIGFLVSDVGLLVLVAATVAAALGLRRAGGRGTAIAGWLSALLIVMYVVAIWAMTTKPV